MDGLKYLLTITNREFAEDYIEFFSKHKMLNVMNFFANGTATTTTLNYMGLEKTEKVMFALMVRNEDIERIKSDLKSQMNINGAGNGIAVFLPVDSIGGESAKKYLIGEQPLIKGETNMSNENQSKLVLLITIADKGTSETVMEAARGAGATGGTTVRAKGTGAEIAKFFGIAMSDEKEMVYIVCKRELRDGIMHAIMDKAGKNSDAHGIVFSLPVDSVCGISGLED